MSEPIGSIAAIRRKLRSVAAMLHDPAATEHERANAAALATRLREQLKERGAPKGDWTDIVFRLGRTVKEIKVSAAPPAAKDDWTRNAFRLGRALRRGIDKWRAG